MPYRNRRRGEIRSLGISYDTKARNKTTGALSYNDVGVISTNAQDGYLETMTDVVTPGFRSKSSRGQIINNEMIKSSLLLKPWNASHTRSWSDATNNWTETITGPVLSHMMKTPVWNETTFKAQIASAQAKAAIDTWKSLEEAQALTVVTAVEANKTIRMISKRVTTLATLAELFTRKPGRVAAAMRELGLPHERRVLPKVFVLWDDRGQPIYREGNIRGTKHMLRGYTLTSDVSRLSQAQRAWLEYRYGWRVLVFEIISLLKAYFAEELRNDLKPRGEIRVARRTATVPYQSLTTLSGAFGGISYQARNEVSGDASIKTYVHFRDKSTKAFRKLNDFGLFDIPLTLWELVPYSFMVDKISPVGDWIAAHTPRFGVEIIDSGYVVERYISSTTTLTTQTSHNTGPYPIPPVIPLGSQDRFVSRVKYRVPRLTLPALPPLAVKSSIPNLLDALALMRRAR